MKSTRVHLRLRPLCEDDFMGSELPTGTLIEQAKLAGLPIEKLTPMNREARVVLHVPCGTRDSSRTLAGQLAASCRARVITPELSLSAGGPFLNGLDDLLAIYRSLLRRGTPAEQIIVVGVGGGGGLALTMLLQARALGLPLPRALILISPGLVAHPASELEGLPSTLIQVGDRELAEIGRIYEGLQAAGVDVELEAYANLRDACEPFEASPNSIEAIDRIGSFVDDRFALQAWHEVG